MLREQGKQKQKVVPNKFLGALVVVGKSRCCSHSKVASLHEDSQGDTLDPQQRTVFEQEST